MRNAPSHKLALTGACVMLFAAAPLETQAEVAGGVIGCDAPGSKQTGGALIGAVLGGIAGNNIARNDRGTGTVVGAAAGAAAGSYVGCKMQKSDATRPAPPQSYSRRDADDDVELVRDERLVEARDQRALPPGLAKKAHGMPPGQAKKYYAVGQRLPAAYVRDTQYYVTEPRRYRLPYPAAGYRWVAVDGDAYLVRSDTGLVREVIRAIVG